MEYEITHGPAFAVTTLSLAQGEQVRCESGAMVSMSGHLDLEAKMNATSQGGFLRRAAGALAKSALGGESFFITTIKADQGPGEVILAPSAPGDVAAHALEGRTLVVQRGSYLASAPGVNIDTSFAGFKGLMGGEGLFFLKASGQGVVFLSSFGAIVEKTLSPGEKYVVDSGHMVAFEDGMTFQTRMVAGQGAGFLSRAITSAKTGEGLVIEYTGPGTVWIQTRNADAFGSWVTPFLNLSDG